MHVQGGHVDDRPLLAVQAAYHFIEHKHSHLFFSIDVFISGPTIAEGSRGSSSNYITYTINILSLVKPSIYMWYHSLFKDLKGHIR